MDIKIIQNKLKKYISKLYILHITNNYDINKYNIYLSKTNYYRNIIGGGGGGRGRIEIEQFEKEIFKVYDIFLKLSHEKQVLWLIKIIKFLVKNNRDTELLIRRIGKFNRKADTNKNKKLHKAKRNFINEIFKMLNLLFFSNNNESIFDSVVKLYFIKFSKLFLVQNNIKIFENFMNRNKKKEEQEKTQISINSIVHLKILNLALNEAKKNLKNIKKEDIEDLDINELVNKIKDLVREYE